MKKLSGFIIILLALILGGSYIAGVYTEKELKATMAAMNDMDETKGFNAHLNNYKRGWFKSTSTLDWKVHIPEQTETEPGQAPIVVPAKDFEFHLPITIYHGPIIIADKTVKFGLGYAFTEINLPADYEKQFHELFTENSEKPRLDISIFVNYLKKSDVNFDVPAFKATTKDNINFIWKGLNSMFSMSRDSNNLDGYFTVHGLQLIKSNQDKFEMGKFETTYDLGKTPSTFFVGSTSINFSSMKLEQAGKTTFALKDFDFRSDSSIDDHLFNASLKTSLDTIDADNKVYGPGKIEITLKNLDADALTRIRMKVLELQKTNNAQGQQLMMAMLPELPQLFGKGPELEISELHFKMPEGTIEGNLKISIPKNENSNPLTMMQNLTGTGKLSIPAAVLKTMLTQSYKEKLAAPQPELQNAIVSEMEKDNANANTNDNTTQTNKTQVTTADNESLAASQADTQIEKMQQSGLLVANGSDYVIEFSLDNGKLNLNGKPFDPSMVKF